MGDVTRVDAVVARLVELFGAATDLTVQDGPSVGEVPYETIVVGMPGDVSDPGYTSNAQRLQGMGPARYQERSEIRSMLTVTTGNTSATEVRGRAATYLRRIDAALRAEQTSDGVWQRVALAGDMNWIVIQHEGGVTCEVFFTVEAESLL